MNKYKRLLDICELYSCISCLTITVVYRSSTCVESFDTCPECQQKRTLFRRGVRK